MGRFVTEELSVRLELTTPGEDADGFILLGCGRTCTGTIGEFKLVGDGVRDRSNLEQLRNALQRMIDNFGPIADEITNIPR